MSGGFSVLRWHSTLFTVVVRGVAWNLLRGDVQVGNLGTETRSGVQGQSPGGGLGAKPPEVGDKYGCRLYRNTMKNAKHTNTEINSMKT